VAVYCRLPRSHDAGVSSMSLFARPGLLRSVTLWAAPSVAPHLMPALRLHDVEEAAQLRGAVLMRWTARAMRRIGYVDVRVCSRDLNLVLQSPSPVAELTGAWMCMETGILGAWQRVG
jgi:hypothetical protein